VRVDARITQTNIKFFEENKYNNWVFSADEDKTEVNTPTKSTATPTSPRTLEVLLGFQS
jgi:hypothetical protein